MTFLLMWDLKLEMKVVYHLKGLQLDAKFIARLRPYDWHGDGIRAGRLT